MLFWTASLLSLVATAILVTIVASFWDSGPESGQLQGLMVFLFGPLDMAMFAASALLWWFYFSSQGYQ